MGGRGPSIRTEMNHKQVIDAYNDLLKEYGPLATKISKSIYYEEISQRTNYSLSGVRDILKKHFTSKRQKHS